MPAPLVGLLLGKLVSGIIRQRVTMTFKMQELAGQLILGAYSAFQGQEVDEMLRQVDKVKIVINALIFIAGPPLLIAVHGNKINANPILYSYFAQFPKMKKHLQAIELGEIRYADRLTKELLEGVLRLYGVEKKPEEVESLLVNPIDVGRLIVDQIKNLWESFIGADPFQFALHVSQNLVNTDYDDSLFTMPDWLARVLNPFIDLDFTVISSLITLLYAMDKSALALELEQIPKAWIPGMRGVLKADGKVIAESYVLKDGSIHFESTKFPEEIRILEVDLHGFRWPLPVTFYLNHDKIPNKWNEIVIGFLMHKDGDNECALVIKPSTEYPWDWCYYFEYTIADMVFDYILERDCESDEVCHRDFAFRDRFFGAVCGHIDVCVLYYTRRPAITITPVTKEETFVDPCEKERPYWTNFKRLLLYKKDGTFEELPLESHTFDWSYISEIAVRIKREEET